MAPKDKRKEAENFLKEFQKAQNSGTHVHMVRRKEAEKQPASLGITEDVARGYLKRLKLEDYFNGPRKDEDENCIGDVWEFGMNINGKLAYIKLKLTKSQNPKSKDVWLTCMAFHLSDRVITYPFKELKDEKK